MYTNGLMNSKSDFNLAVCDRFQGGDNLNLLFNSFQGCNEEQWVVTEGRGSILKCRETSFEGRGF